MDLRTYIEESEEAWMWIYKHEDQTEAVNLVYAVEMWVHSEGEIVTVRATMHDGEEVVLKDFHSGGAARDFLQSIMASVNEREGGRRDNLSERVRGDTYGIGGR